MNIIENKPPPVKQLKEIIHPFADESLMQELSELEEKIVSSKFYVVVLGLFKRGKSSLINALLEKELAPVGIVPLTAIITVFEYGTGNYAEVIFMDHTKKEIPLSQIKEYVTEKNNPDNTKGVRYVKIYDDAYLLRQMSLIDTPGLGSEFEHNTQTTLSFVHQIDAALFVMSADTPVSQSDLQLLKQLQRTVPRILYVLNKSDLLSAEDLNQMEAYNKNAIKNSTESTISEDKEQGSSDWISLSTRNDSEGYHYIELLRKRLIHLSEKEKKEILQKSTVHRCKALISEAGVQLQLQLDALQMPLYKLKEKQEKFHEALVMLQEQRNEFEQIMKGHITQLKVEIDHEVKACEKALNAQLKDQLLHNSKQAYHQMQQTGVVTFQKEIIDHIIKQFDNTKQILEEKTLMQFRNLLDQYCKRSQSFFNEMATHLQSLLGIDYHQISEQFDLNTYTAFYFERGRGENPLYLKPSFLLQITHADFLEKKFIRKIYRLSYQLVVTNTSGIIYDLQYKIQESFRKFNYDLNYYLDNLIKRIGKVITDTLAARNDQTYATDSRKRELSDALESLHSLNIS